MYLFYLISNKNNDINIKINFIRYYVFFIRVFFKVRIIEWFKNWFLYMLKCIYMVLIRLYLEGKFFDRVRFWIVIGIFNLNIIFKS